MAKEIFGDDINENSEAFFIEFLNELSENTPVLSALLYPEREPKEYRNLFLCGHSVMAVALGMFGSKLISRHSSNWKDKLEALSKTNIWYRDSGLFEGRCEINGKMKSSRKAAQLTALKLMQICDVDLMSHEQKEAEMLLVA